MLEFWLILVLLLKGSLDVVPVTLCAGKQYLVDCSNKNSEIALNNTVMIYESIEAIKNDELTECVYK